MAKVSEFNFLFAYVVPGALAIHAANKLKIFVYDTEREVSWWRLLKETFFISVVADMLFYWQHRAMHTPALYFLHKKHHEFKYSLALVHHYMSYRESVLFALPQALPPLLLWGLTGHRQHLLSMWLAFSFTQLAAILGHAGWKVPLPDWLPFLKPSYHDLHHVGEWSSSCAWSECPGLTPSSTRLLGQLRRHLRVDRRHVRHARARPARGRGRDRQVRRRKELRLRRQRAHDQGLPAVPVSGGSRERCS